MTKALRDAALTRLSSDIGGTFTDVVLEIGGTLSSTKVLTDSKRPERGVLKGAKLLLERAGLSFSEVDVFIHGTTLATNAVLERRGALTALITTDGYRDVLEIGTEGRFEQYDLEIEKRPPLIPRSLRLTVPERMDANGDVRLALDEEALKRHAQHLKELKVQSVAICFLHAYANSAHEQRARELLATELPDVFLSLSSEVCPEIREYERASTTVANAYVQPQMADYLARMRSELEQLSFGGAIYLVTSNGGLTSLETACRFPVRLIESGPAGGAIFAADVAARVGEKQVVAFDMGGTTAKVCLIRGYEPDRDRVYEVDRAARFQKNSGLPLRIPVIDLVEIGAGGGSIASINGLKSVMVGPHSAGSDPGPACYSSGGTQPTVTDADCALGLLDPTTFAGGTLRLDGEAARQALAAHIGTPLGFSPEMAAYAVHEIVRESMASAARVHAIEKGRTLSDHTLVAFGGAAPLHAARVAEKIGVDKVIIPRSAGVGSAVGFLRAPVSYEVVRSYHAVLDQLDFAEISPVLEDMEAEARHLVSAGAPGARLAVRKLAFMRYVGQGQEIAITIPDRPLIRSDQAEIRARFEKEYTEFFNRTIPGASIEVLSWSVLVTAEQDREASQSAVDPKPIQAVAAGMRSYFDGRLGATIDVPVYQRDQLKAGARVQGPALVAERETTTFVSDAFDAQIDAQDNIVLQRKRAAAQPLNPSRRASVIDMQVMWQRLITIVEEQAQALLRTAFSPIVRECEDLSAGVFDCQGRMLAQAITGAPGHVNTMAQSVRFFLSRYSLETMKPGDVFITNDPWNGTGHLNDFVVVTPCFLNEKPVALFCSTSHVMDIGGIGFGPDGEDVFMEGLYIPPLPLFKAGRLNETLMAFVCGNTRQPTETEGDTYALAACNDVGARRLTEMMKEFGVPTLDEVADYIIVRSREAVLAEVAKLPRGTWTNTMTVDGYDVPLQLSATMSVTDTGIHVDYAGTSRHSDRGINVPINYTAAYTFFGLACALAGRTPNNSGSLSVFSVSAPDDCVLNAIRPAPVSARHVIGQMLPDVVFGCLRQVVPDRIPAEGTSSVWLITLRGEDQSRRAGRYGFTLGFTSNGGTGARPSKDGLSATAFPTNLAGTPVEIAETQTPLLFWRKELREDSGGHGRTRGGFGQVIEIESATKKPFQVLANFERIKYPPRGYDGGRDGAAGFIGLKSGAVLRGKGAQNVSSGERLILMTPGGAGRGEPRLRPRDEVTRDVSNQLLSPTTARDVYGIDLGQP